MKNDQVGPKKNDDALRKRAVKQLLEKEKALKGTPRDSMTPADMKRLLQELQIHQIELEMQNEELQRTRDEAEMERERYLDLYDFAPVGYFTLDTKGAILQVNLAGAGLLGLERSRLIGNRFAHFVPDNDISIFKPFLLKVFTEKEKVSCSISIKNKKGRLISVQMEATPTGDNRQCRMAVVDVTARKNAEDDLRKLQDELEERIAERTSQLTAAVKEIESFSYSVSHDLQTPLRAIDGYSRMILRAHGGDFDEDTRKKFEIIRQNTMRMGQLIEHLLAFSRLGRKHISLTEINMNAIVHEAWENLRIVHCDQTLTLTCENLPPVMGDRTLIAQVVNNLLQNAVKFSKNRSEIRVEVRGYSNGKNNIYFVKDNGAGFDMEYSNKLFGMFQRLHGADEFEGMGIGLAMVQRIVTRHGGRVWASAKENEGATFYFELPAHPDARMISQMDRRMAHRPAGLEPAEKKNGSSG